jgi:tRNA(Ile2) C34 agmatinyltransferase TiaS
MRFLPLAMTMGSLLAEAIRDASQGPRRKALCGYCGARIPVIPGRTQQKVRCPGCARWQLISNEEEAPWRLSPGAIEALRRARAWPRWPS